MADHVSPSSGDITEVVVPLLAQYSTPAHQGHRLLVLRTPAVLQVPELYMPGQKGNHEHRMHLTQETNEGELYLMSRSL